MNIERFADVHERERPTAVIGQEPSFGLSTQLTAAAIGGPQMLLEAHYSIFQDSNHKTALAAGLRFLLERSKELCGQQQIWLEEGSPRLSSDEFFLHREASPLSG